MAATARVGIEWFNSDTQARAGIRSLANFLVDTMGEANRKIGAVGAGSPGADEEVKRRKKKTADEIAEIAKRADDAIAASAKRRAQLEVQYSDDSGDRIIKDIKGMQDKRSEILHAMAKEVDKEARQELNIRQKQIADELKLYKQVALDKKSISEGGAGGSVGLLGTGRQKAGGGGGLMDMVGGLVTGGGGLASLGSLSGGLAAVGGPAVLAVGLKEVISIGAEFEAGQKELQAITGVTDEQLKGLGGSARQLAKDFGGDATAQLTSMKGVLSRLGGDIAKSPEALERMTRAINTMSTASGDTAEASMDALTSSMLQFNVSLDDPIKAAAEMERMMNVLAAGAKVGAAEIPQMSEAIVVAGSALSNANVSFEESGAAIQVVAAKAGKYGSEAGTGIRNIVGLMQKNSKEAKGIVSEIGLDFDTIGKKLNTEGLGSALEYLQGGLEKITDPAKRNAAVMQIFGTENASVASALLQNTEQLAEYKEAMTGTNTANKQAEIRMQTFEFQSGRMLAMLKDIAITLFQALQPALAALMEAIGPILDIVGWIVTALVDYWTWIGKIYIAVVSWIAQATGLVDAFNWIVQAVKDVIEWVKGVIDRFGEFQETISNTSNTISGLFQKAIDGIGAAFTWFWGILQDVGDFLLMVFEPLVVSITETFNFLWGVLRDIAEFVSGIFLSAWDSVASVLGGVGDAVGTVTGLIGSLVGWVVQAAKDVGNWVLKFLGLENAIKSVVGWIGDLIGTVSDAINGVGALLGLADEEAAKPITKTVNVQPLIKPPAMDISGGANSKAEEVKKETAGENKEREKGQRDAQRSRDKAAKDALDARKKAFENELRAQRNAYETELNTLEERNIKGELAAGEYEAEKANIALRNGEKLKEITSKYGEDVAEIERSISKIRLDILKLRTAEAEKIEAFAAQKMADQLSDDISFFEDEAKRQLALQNEVEKRRANDRKKASEETLEAALDFEAERYQREVELAQDNAELLGLITEEHEKNKQDIRDKYAAESVAKTKEWVGEILDIWTTTIEPDKGLANEITDSLKKETKEADKEYKATLANINKQRNAELRAAKGDKDAEARIRASWRDSERDAETDHNRKKEEAANLAAKKMEDLQAESERKKRLEMAQTFLREKLGIETNLETLIKNKAIEAAVWIATEFQKTAATETNILARIGMVAGEVWANIQSAASSVLTGAASVIKWIAGLVPWPFNLALIPLGVAGIYGAWEGAKALFGFADGVIATQPIFSPLMMGGAVMGEAGPEALIPLDRFPSLMAQTAAQAMPMEDIVKALHEVRGAVETMKIAVPVDPYGLAKSAQMQKAIQDETKY
jgi:TP901 family phage tail tape measure protein